MDCYQIGLDKLNAMRFLINIANVFLDVTGSENETKGRSTTCDLNSGNCEKNREARPQEDPNPAIADPTREEKASNSKQLGTLVLIDIC